MATETVVADVTKAPEFEAFLAYQSELLGTPIDEVRALYANEAGNEEAAADFEEYLATLPAPDSRTPAEVAADELLGAPVDPKQAKAEKKSAELVDRAVEVGVKLETRHLSGYVKGGAAMFAVIAHCRNSIVDQWKPSDFDQLCNKVRDRIRAVEACSPRPDDWVRVFLFVEGVKAFAPKVTELSYNVVINKLVPAAFGFSKQTLEGSYGSDTAGGEAKPLPTGATASVVNPQWVDFLTQLIEKQTGPQRMGTVALDQAIAEHTTALKVAAQVGLTQEQIAQAAEQHKRKEKVAKRNKARTRVSAAVSDAVKEGLTASEITDAITESDAILPSVGPDPAKCSEEQAIQFVTLLDQANNTLALRALFEATVKVFARRKKESANLTLISGQAA